MMAFAIKLVSMKGFDNLVCSSSLGERYPFERITPFPATKEKNQIRA